MEPKSLFYRRIPKIEPLLNMSKQYNHGKCGGRNLGNTCYMNSSIACLSNCSELTSYFLSGEYNYEKEINEKNKHGTRGSLPKKWHDLLHNYWLSDISAGNPSSFKSTMGNFAPRFSGYGQQDSNEFMTFFLDFMNEDLNKNHEKKYEEIKEQQSNESDIQCAKRFWDYFLHRNDSIITDLFTGLFKNCVTCPKCNYISITYEPFNILQLPIPNEKKVKSTNNTNDGNIEVEINMYNDNETKLNTYKFIMEKKTNGITIDDIIEELKKYRKIYSLNDYIFFEVTEKIFIKILNKNNRLDEVSEISKIYCFKIKDKDSKIYPIYIFKDKEEQSNYPRILEISRYTGLKSIIEQLYNYTKKYLQIKQYYDFENFIDKYKQEKLPFNFIFKKDEQNKIDLIKLFLEEKSSFTMNDFIEKIEKEKYYFSINIDSKNELVKQNFNLDVFEEEKLEKKNYYYSYSRSRDTNISLDDCFEAFREEETLNRGNEWYCCKCKEHVLAKKKMDLFYLPKLFVICLKRFSRGRYWGKNDDNIDFKINNMDMKEYVCGPDKNNSVYDCFAVSQHYGSTGGGHYTAICKNIDGNWYEYDDSSCYRASESNVVTSAAYVIFYRRKTD